MKLELLMRLCERKNPKKEKSYQSHQKITFITFYNGVKTVFHIRVIIFPQLLGEMYFIPIFLEFLWAFYKFSCWCLCGSCLGCPLLNIVLHYKHAVVVIIIRIGNIVNKLSIIDAITFLPIIFLDLTKLTSIPTFYFVFTISSRVKSLLFSWEFLLPPSLLSCGWGYVYHPPLLLSIQPNTRCATIMISLTKGQ